MWQIPQVPHCTWWCVQTCSVYNWQSPGTTWPSWLCQVHYRFAYINSSIMIYVGLLAFFPRLGLEGMPTALGVACSACRSRCKKHLQVLHAPTMSAVTARSARAKRACWHQSSAVDEACCLRSCLGGTTPVSLSDWQMTDAPRRGGRD